MTADPWVLVPAAVVGVVIGSFLNVVIHRVPRGESVVRPASRCPGCSTSIRRRDNVPVLSWLLLRGRCRDCRTPIPWRYPFVELATGVVFALIAARVGVSWALPAYLYFGAVAVALTVIDLDVQRLPDAIVGPSYLVGAGLLGVASAGSGDWAALVRAGIGGVALFGLYALVVVVYPKGMGLGDVKLAGVLGMYLGWWGWDALAVGAFAAFLFGGLVGAVVMAVVGKGRGTRIPFGPWMLLGAASALFISSPVAAWYLSMTGIASV